MRGAPGGTCRRVRRIAGSAGEWLPGMMEAGVPGDGSPGTMGAGSAGGGAFGNAAAFCARGLPRVTWRALRVTKARGRISSAAVPVWPCAPQRPVGTVRCYFLRCAARTAKARGPGKQRSPLTFPSGRSLRLFGSLSAPGTGFWSGFGARALRRCWAGSAVGRGGTVHTHCIPASSTAEMSHAPYPSASGAAVCLTPRIPALPARRRAGRRWPRPGRGR